MAKNKKDKKKNRMPARKRTPGGYTPTAVREDGITMLAIKDDKTRRLDVIPFIAGKGNPYADEGQMHYERTFWVHRGIGADKDTYVCPLKTFKKACPICEFRRELDADPDADEKLVKDLLPKERQLWNVIDTADREKGIQVWDISYHLFGKQLEARTDDVDPEDEHYQYFAEFDEGSTLRIGFEEKSFGSFKYYEANNIDFKERRQQYTEDIVGQAHCLGDLLIEVPYDKLKSIFLQADTTAPDDDGGDDDGGDDPKPKKKGKKCLACGGSGEASKGGECVPCGGTGKKGGKGKTKPAPETTPEDELDDVPFNEPPKDGGKKGKAKKGKKDKGKKGKAKKGGGQKCPGNGVFGEDTDELEACDDCPLWDACDDKKNG